MEISSLLYKRLIYTEFTVMEPVNCIYKDMGWY